MLDKFRSYLLQKDSFRPNHVPYYMKWVADCYSFLNVPDITRINSDQKRQYLNHLAKSHEDWQVKQADTALRLYDYFLSRDLKTAPPGTSAEGHDWPVIEVKLQEALRLRHKAYSTEKTIFSGFGISGHM